MLAHGARPQWQAIIVFVISFLITRIVGTAETLSANLNGNHSSPTMFQGMNVDMKSREFANFLDWAEIWSDEGSMSQEWHTVSQTGSTVPNSLKIPVYNGHFYEFNVSYEHMMLGWHYYLKLIPFRDSFTNGFSDLWAKCNHICPGKPVQNARNKLNNMYEFLKLTTYGKWVHNRHLHSNMVSFRDDFTFGFFDDQVKHNDFIRENLMPNVFIHRDDLYEFSNMMDKAHSNFSMIYRTVPLSILVAWGVAWHLQHKASVWKWLTSPAFTWSGFFRAGFRIVINVLHAIESNRLSTEETALPEGAVGWCACSFCDLPIYPDNPDGYCDFCWKPSCMHACQCVCECEWGSGDEAIEGIHCNTRKGNYVFSAFRNVVHTLLRCSTRIGGLIFWLFMVQQFVYGDAVTCHTCFDQIAGCAGGAACLFATRTAANTNGLVAGAGAVVTVAALLPLSYIRHLPSQVLRTLTAIARRPANGAPPDLGPMTLTELQNTLDSGQIELSVLKNELSSRLADNGTAAAMVTRIAAMLQSLPANATSTSMNIQGISTIGPIGYLMAVASIIVASGQRTYSSMVGGSLSATSAQSSLAIKVPQSEAQFFELLMVWQALLHATGVANYLASTPFVQQVVFDSINELGFTWIDAYCMLVVYIEAVEDSKGALNLGNVYAYGAQDSRITAAKVRKQEFFPKGPPDRRQPDDLDDKNKGGPHKKWNGKDSPNATKICRTYNFKDAKHPDQHLYKDGTCKFRHVCMQWVTGKGAGGCCEGDHPKFDCKNPGKCAKPEE